MGAENKGAENKDHRTAVQVIRNAITGKNAHMEAGDILDGLDWEKAGSRPGNTPHSALQLLNHIIFWQEWAIQWLDGKKPAAPKHASDSWPGPGQAESEQEWRDAVRRFAGGLDELDKRTLEGDIFQKRGKYSRLEMIEIIVRHNSYHLGQIVAIRQMLGAWPPPSGGLTW
jgi:uncharacterized damage-inducible protein DinB